MRGQTPASEAADVSRHLANASRNFLYVNRHVGKHMPTFSVYTERIRLYTPR